MNEAETRAKLIDPALHGRGWTEDLIRREVTAGRIIVHGDEARQARRGRIDYTLRVQAAGGSQPVAVALIEAKKEALHPAHGLDQGKAYARAKRMNVPFVFSSNVNVVAHAVLADLGVGDGEVRAEIAEAQRLGIRAVPTFVFDGRTAVQGAQPTSTFLRVLEGLAREGPGQARAETPEAACGDGACTP